MLHKPTQAQPPLLLFPVFPFIKSSVLFLISPPAFSYSSLVSCNLHLYLKLKSPLYSFFHLYTMKSAALFHGACDEHNYQPHFLDSCFLCHRTLAHNSDIFMYRGNTPFCSQECRQEQIEIDEANERRWNKSNTSRKTADSSKESTSKAARTDAVAVA